jgi:hypothetical protein
MVQSRSYYKEQGEWNDRAENKDWGVGGVRIREDLIK